MSWRRSLLVLATCLALVACSSSASIREGDTSGLDGGAGAAGANAGGAGGAGGAAGAGAGASSAGGVGGVAGADAGIDAPRGRLACATPFDCEPLCEPYGLQGECIDYSQYGRLCICKGACYPSDPQAPPTGYDTCPPEMTCPLGTSCYWHNGAGLGDTCGDYDCGPGLVCVGGASLDGTCQPACLVDDPPAGCSCQPRSSTAIAGHCT